MFDNLVSELGTKFGLGAQASPLMGEVLQLVTGGSGGIGGFLDRFRTAGFGNEVVSWMGGSGAAALSAQSIEQVVGTSAISGIASRLGLGSAAISSAMGFVIPKVVGLLTPGGKLPAATPPEVANFIRPVQPVGAGVAEPAAYRAAAAEQVAPRSIHVVHAQPNRARWLWPLLGALVLLGLGTYFFTGHENTAPVTPVAPVAVQAPAVPAALPAPALPAHLALSNDDGVVHYSGSVHDADTKNSIVGSLTSVYGADKIQGDVGIDANRAAAPWLTNLRAGLENLKMPGMQAVFDGNSVNLGGSLSDADRDQLKGVLGGGLVIGALADQASDLVTSANAKAAASLAALRPGFTPSDLVGVLNQSIVNFPSGSAVLPTVSVSLLQTAAAQIKLLPPGTVLEVAGYTDNTGDPAANVTLSQQRAEAVRTALIQAGVSPSALVAKGYGNANPVASNDEQQGRFRNRRIEYHVQKS